MFMDFHLCVITLRVTMLLYFDIIWVRARSHFMWAKATGSYAERKHQQRCCTRGKF